MAFELKFSPASTQENTNQTNETRTEQADNTGATQSGTTAFFEDSGVVESQSMRMISLDSALVASASSGAVQDIRAFLAKPQIVYSGNLSTANTGNLDLWSEDFPEALVATSLYQQKLAGYLGFRGTLYVKAQVNANKFQQGRYMLRYIPNGGEPNAPTKFWNFDLRQKTQHPRVELDLNCDTSCTLKVPFISPQTHFNLIGTPVNVARVYLTCYAPLQTPATINIAEITIWAWYEDVELAAPTVPYTGPAFAKPIVMKAEMAVGRNVNASDKEAVDLGIASVASAAKGIKAGVNSFTGKVAMTALTGTVGWASSLMAGALSAIGFSKPTNLMPANRVTLDVQPYSATCDAPSQSIPLSLTSGAQVEQFPFAGSNEDEMNISHFTGISAYQDTLTWTCSDVSGTLINYYNLDPSSFTTIYGDIGTAHTNYFRTWNPTSYASGMFQYYRGSLEFHFKVVKTQFHSGRLLIAYAPGKTGTLSSMADTAFLHREIVDLRDSNEFSFVCPYASTSPYKRTRLDPYGSLHIYVLNQLVAPDSVSTNVKILVEINAAPDFELAVPIGYAKGENSGTSWTEYPEYIPYLENSGISPPMALASVEPATFPVMNAEMNVCDATPAKVMPGNGTLNPSSLDAARFCIGERITNWRQVLKRTSWMTEIQGRVFANFFYMRPWSILYFFSYTDGTLSKPTFFGDTYSALSACYAYSRGGVRIKVQDEKPYTMATAPVNAICQTILSFLYDNAWIPFGGVTPAGGEIWTQNLPVQQHKVDLNGTIDVEIPQYLGTYARLNNFANDNAPEGVRMYDPLAHLWVRYNYSGAQINLGREASDDTSFGFFVSTPTTYSSTSTP